MLALALSSALGINRQLLWGNDDVTVAAKELPLCLQDCACVSDLSQQTYSHGYGSCQVQKAFAQSALRPDDVTGAYCADDCTGADSYWRSYLETLKGMDCTGVFQDGATAKVWTDSSSSSSLNQQVGAWFADNNDIWSNDNNSPWRKLWSTSATTSTSKTLRSSRGGIGHMKVAIHPRRLAESLARALTTICTLEPTKAPTTPPTLAPTTSPTKKSDFMHDCLATCPCPNQAASGATCIESKAFAIAALQTDCMGGCPVEVTNAIIAASSRKCDDDGSQVGVRTGKKASADSLWSQFRPRFRRLNSGAGNWASIFTQGAKEEEEDEEKYDVSITAVACTLAPTKAPTAAPSRSPTKAPTATPELAGCMTNSIGGGSNGRDQPCAFPFTYKGVTYDTCTDTDATNKNEGLWCSTKTDWFGQHVSGGGNYGNCVESPATGCDLPCRTNGDTSTPKPRTACVFPFIYQGKTYASCASDEDHPAGWCSTLTDLFDSHIQGNWGYCNTEGCAGSADGPIPEFVTTNAPTKSPTAKAPTKPPTKPSTPNPSKAATKAPSKATTSPPAQPLACMVGTATATGTFVAPGVKQTRFPNQTPFKVSGDVFVFGSLADGGPSFKMASVDSTGTVIAGGNRYRNDISDLSELTIGLWETSEVPAWQYPATVEDVSCPAPTPPTPPPTKAPTKSPTPPPTPAPPFTAVPPSLQPVMDDNANWRKGVRSFSRDSCYMQFERAAADFEAARDEKDQTIKKIMFRNLPDSSTTGGEGGRPMNLNGQWIPVKRIGAPQTITLGMSDPYFCSEHVIRLPSSQTNAAYDALVANAEFFAVDQNNQFVDLDPTSSRDSVKLYNPASSGDLSGVQFQSFADAPFKGVSSSHFCGSADPGFPLCRRTFSVGWHDARSSDCVDLPGLPAPAWCKFSKTGEYILFQGLPKSDGGAADGEEDEPPNNVWLRVEKVDLYGTRFRNPCNSKDYKSWSLPAQGKYALVSADDLPDDALQVSACLVGGTICKPGYQYASQLDACIVVAVGNLDEDT